MTTLTPKQQQIKQKQLAQRGRSRGPKRRNIPMTENKRVRPMKKSIPNQRSKRTIDPIGIGYQVKTTYAKTSFKFQHRELIGSYTGAEAFTISRTLMLNAGNATTFPWLGPLAANFEYYRFNSLKFSYVNNVATTQAGSGHIGYTYDYKTVAPTTLVKMSNYEGTTTFSVRDAAVINVGTDKEYRYVVNGNAPTDTDGHFYFLGQLWTASSGCGGSITLGNLWVEYSVELCNPVNPVDNDLMKGIQNWGQGEYMDKLVDFTLGTFCNLLSLGLLNFIMQRRLLPFTEVYKTGKRVTADHYVACITVVDPGEYTIEQHIHFPEGVTLNQSNMNFWYPYDNIATTICYPMSYGYGPFAEDTPSLITDYSIVTYVKTTAPNAIIYWVNSTLGAYGSPAYDHHNINVHRFTEFSEIERPKKTRSSPIPGKLASFVDEGGKQKELEYEILPPSRVTK